MIKTYRRATQDQANNCLTSNVDVLESTQDVNLLVGQNHSCAAGVFNSELGLSILSSDTSNSTPKVLSVQCLHILDLECLNVQVVKTEKSNCIVEIKAQSECLDEISALLQGSHVVGEFGCSQFDRSALQVHANLQLQVFDNWGTDLSPVCLERGHAVRWDGDLSRFDAVCGGHVLGRGEDRTAFFVDAHFTLGGLLDGVGGHTLGGGLGVNQNLIVVI